MGMTLGYNKFPCCLGMGTVDIQNLKKVKFHSLQNKVFLQLPKLCSAELDICE
jgi:hypothetical protein